MTRVKQRETQSKELGKLHETEGGGSAPIGLKLAAPKPGVVPHSCPVSLFSAFLAMGIILLCPHGLDGSLSSLHTADPG